MTEFRGAETTRRRGGQGLDTGPATQPSHRVDRVHGARAREGQQQGKRRTIGGQGLDTEPGAGKRRTRPGHRAQPQSPATELTEFRGAGPGHRAQPQSSGARPRGGQEEDKAQPQSPATELTEFRGAAKRSTSVRARPALSLSLSLCFSFVLSFFRSFFLSFCLSFFLSCVLA